MLDKHALKLHTSQDLDRAKKKGQILGWIQGAAVTFGGLLLLQFIGWIPVLLILAGVAALGYKLMTMGDEEDA